MLNQEYIHRIRTRSRTKGEEGWNERELLTMALILKVEECENSIGAGRRWVEKKTYTLWV